MDKEVLRCIYNIYTIEYYSVIKNKELLPFVTTWMDLEGIMLSEMSDRDRQVLYDLTYMWNLENKNNANKLIEKSSDLHLPEAGHGGGHIEGRWLKVQTSSYKIHKY